MFYTFSKKTQPSSPNLVPIIRSKNIKSFGNMFDIQGPSDCGSCPKPARVLPTLRDNKTYH